MQLTRRLNQGWLRDRPFGCDALDGLRLSGRELQAASPPISISGHAALRVREGPAAAFVPDASARRWPAAFRRPGRGECRRGSGGVPRTRARRRSMCGDCVRWWRVGSGRGADRAHQAMAISRLWPDLARGSRPARGCRRPALGALANAMAALAAATSRPARIAIGALLTNPGGLTAYATGIAALRRGVVAARFARP